MMPLTDSDFDTISAYLDDELSNAERAALEARLVTDPQLAAELERVRRTKQVLRAAPRLKVPRDFVLDPAVYGRRTPWWARYRTMQAVGALGTIAAMLLLVFGVMFMGVGNMAPPNTSSVAGAPTVATRVFRTATAAAALPVPSNFAAQATVTSDGGWRAETLSALQSSPLPSSTATPTATATVTPAPTRTALLFATAQESTDSVGQAAPVQAQPVAPQSGAPPSQQLGPQSGAADGANAAGAAGGSAAAKSGLPTSTLVRPRPTNTLRPTQAPRTAAPAIPPTAGAGALAAAPTLIPTAIQSTENVIATPLASLHPPAISAATAAATAAATEPIMQQAIVSPVPDLRQSLSPTPQPTATLATAATRDDQLNKDQAQQKPNEPVASIPASQLLLVGGLGLLVFSVSLFAVGTLRSRL